MCGELFRAVLMKKQAILPTVVVQETVNYTLDYLLYFH